MPGQTSVQIVPHRVDDKSQGPLGRGATTWRGTSGSSEEAVGFKWQVLQKGALGLIMRLPCQKTFHTRQVREDEKQPPDVA